MKNFGSHDARNISYNLDVKANARGSYNFIIGLLYTQIFQELYYQADFNCGGRLPIHVTFMLDEFANGVTRSTPKTVGITDKSVA